MGNARHFCDSKEAFRLTAGSVIDTPGIGALYRLANGTWQGTRPGALHGSNGIYTAEQVSRFSPLEVVHNNEPGHPLNADEA